MTASDVFSDITALIVAVGPVAAIQVVVGWISIIQTSGG